MVATSVYLGAKRLCMSLQEMVGLRRRKGLKRDLRISEPFNLKKEAVILPGLSEDEITVLREKAAASRLGVAATDSTSSPLLLSGSSSSSRLSSSAAALPHPSRLSIPAALPAAKPIPIPNHSRPQHHHRHRSRQQRHHRHERHHRHGYPSLRSSCTAAEATPAAAGMVEGGNGGISGGAGGGVRTSLSTNDLLLFGGGVQEDDAVLLSSNLGKGPSPLELDLMKLDLEFDFQLGSPVSPLSPLPGASRIRRV
ncbi:hypothetical protein VTK26DRAFT_6863 [Humicola hyalothermophila]